MSLINDKEVFKSVCLCLAVLEPLSVVILHNYLGPGPLRLLINLRGPGPTSIQAVQEHRHPAGHWPPSPKSWSPGALCHIYQPEP